MGEEVKYSEAEIRYAINAVMANVIAVWIWPLFNIRYWMQEQVVAELKCWHEDREIKRFMGKL